METVISTFHIAIMEDLRAVIQVLVESNADLNLKVSFSFGNDSMIYYVLLCLPIGQSWAWPSAPLCNVVR